MTGNRYIYDIFQRIKTLQKNKLPMSGKYPLFLISSLLFFTVCARVLLPDENVTLFAREYIDTYAVKNNSISLEIECHSGTPPILDFILKDKEQIVERLFFDFDNDGLIDLETLGLRDEKVENEVVFRGVPYRKKGIYALSVYLKTHYGTFLREFDIAFTDFLWGRDNYNFANDGKFENSIDFVSKTVIEWAENRFGYLTEQQQVILLHVMYSIYKGSIGRCYGFTGGEVHYMENPDFIPYIYTSIFSMDERDAQIIKEMDYVQNDIVFSNFISGQIDIEKPQDTHSLISELTKIRHSINGGEPIILGYISRKMHHSMVVYGYFENKFRNNITLLTANNWERDQNNNLFSEDAENIKIRFNEGSSHVSWFDLTKKKYRYPQMIFAIVREESYSLDPNDFFTLLLNTENRMRQNNNNIIMVEKTEVAYIINDEGKKRGYKKPRYFNETDDIFFKKVDYNYIFEVPKGREYSLVLKKARYNKELNKKKEVNVFGIIPSETSIQSVMLYGINVSDDEETVFRVNGNGISLIK